jgi:hypothetical protein
MKEIGRLEERPVFKQQTDLDVAFASGKGRVGIGTDGITELRGASDHLLTNLEA